MSEANPRAVIACMTWMAESVEPVEDDVRVKWAVPAGEAREVMRRLSMACGRHRLLRDLAKLGWLGREDGRSGACPAKGVLASFSLLRFVYGEPVRARSDGAGGVEGLWLPTVWRESAASMVLGVAAGGEIWMRLYSGVRLVRKRRLRVWE